MSSIEVLRAAEQSSLSDNQIISHVVGKELEKEGFAHRWKKWGALGFVVAMVIIAVIFLGSGSLIPAATSELLVQATDVQYADGVASKLLALQQILAEGKTPSNTIARLKNKGVLVGMVQNGEFIESANGNALKMGDKIITAANFYNTAMSDTQLYEIIVDVTYARSAYWYDESAMEVMREIGTNRDNYTKESDFDVVMDKLVGEGSNIAVNNVVLVEKTGDNGERYYEYELVGSDAKSTSAAESFVNTVGSKNTASDVETATMNAADVLNVADITAKEQKSSIFFLAFMENISKMKAGYGSASKINEAMNYLYREEESTVVDVNTGEVVTVKGSMVESPSLYAVLSGEKIDVRRVENYASGRVLKTVGNQLGVNSATNKTLNGTITSTSSKIRGTVGRFIDNKTASANSESLAKVVPTVDNSLVNNSFNDIKGIAGGELLVEGAVNVGRKLAMKSGATGGDAEAVKRYMNLTSTVLALDAEIDRRNRSPFDISSPNTFLGSIVYKLAVGLWGKSSLIQQIGVIGRAALSSIAAISPVSFADDNTEAYLANFGDCERLDSIGAVGSATCSTIATFDTSTLNDPFNDAGFIKFVDENTYLENGVRKIKDNSVLAEFIKYNNERKTTLGVIDGGILQAIKTNSGSIPFVSDILAMIETSLGASEAEKRIASGAVFINTSSNPNWDNYKYAQRYVSLARATDDLRAYDGDETAYNNMKFFEGNENPVVAFLNEYYEKIASQ